jgi:hypothetical protein
MPRKQELTAVKVLEYFGTAPYDAAVLVLQLSGQAVKMRAPKQPEKGKGKKDPGATNRAVDEATRSSAGTPPAAQTGQAPPASPRPRRQTAGASQPASSTAASPAAGGTTTTAPAGQVDGLPGMATV